jgi:hypothetical protein
MSSKGGGVVCACRCVGDGGELLSCAGGQGVGKLRRARRGGSSRGSAGGVDRDMYAVLWVRRARLVLRRGRWMGTSCFPQPSSVFLNSPRSLGWSRRALRFFARSHEPNRERVRRSLFHCKVDPVRGETTNSPPRWVECRGSTHVTLVGTAWFQCENIFTDPD